MRKTGPIIAMAVFALTACDPGPGSAPPPAPALTAPVTDVAQLVAAARAGIAQAPSAAFTTDAVVSPDTKSVTGSLRFDGSTSSLTMLLDGSEVRVLGKKTYTRTPGAAIPGKPWVGTDPDSPDPMAQAAGVVVPTIVQLPDLGRTLAEIERTGRIVSADRTGLANHYRLELDPTKAPDLFPEFIRVPLDGKPAAPVTGKLPAELWLDAALRPVRFTVDLSPGFEQPGPTVKGTTEYRDWGKPVTIEAPPGDQVVDLSELLKKLGT
ncbi:hypothetical protein [Amycolatopsis sp. cmx-8-4]|uniref:hypothetical protein n=1 Tax=Amycolatopsis sp. cmx-8-4 TaxID=2790947 RepID=UPI00397A18AE